MTGRDAFLFDVDGTLLDTRGLIQDSHKAVADAMGWPRPPAEKVSPWIGRELAACVRGIHTRVTDADLPRAIEAYRTWQAAHWRDYLRLFDGVAEGLAELKARGKRLGVVTSRRRVSLVPFLEAAGIADYFEVMVTPDDVTLNKPDPAPVAEALRLLGVEPAAAVYVGDADCDVESGARAGVMTVLVAWGGMDPATFPHPPDRVIHTFAELLAP